MEDLVKLGLVEVYKMSLVYSTGLGTSQNVKEIGKVSQFILQHSDPHLAVCLRVGVVPVGPVGAREGEVGGDLDQVLAVDHDGR